MNTKAIKFKTNLNCGACVSKIQNDMDALSEVLEWRVDTTDADKILYVTATAEAVTSIIKVVEKKGFDIELID